MLQINDTEILLLMAFSEVTQEDCSGWIYGEPFVSKWRYKIPCVGVPKINSICFINSILSTLSGRDRLDVLYQLDFIHFIW